LVLGDVNIIDVASGTISRGNVLIRDSLIVGISEDEFSPEKADCVIDGSGHFLIPGLWDMHVHIQDSTYLSMFLDFGIVGVRDMGGCVDSPSDGCESLCAEHLNPWKRAIREGKMEGPQLVIAGKLFSGTGWPTSHSVSTKKEVTQAFQQNVEDSVDFIKVYEKIPWESYQEIARLSRANGLNFVGHVSEPYLLSDILDLGQKSIEHIREPILFSFTDDPDELEAFMVADSYSEEDRKYVQHWIADAENVVEAFKTNKAWFTPTMAVQYARQRYDDGAWIDHPLRIKLPVTVTMGLNKHMEAMRVNKDKEGDSLWWMALTKLVKRFQKEKIGLLAGSDTACEGGIPGYSLHEELFLLVEEAGLTPLQAMQTATMNPCLYFDGVECGKVAEGRPANLVLLTANPLDNIRNTLAIKAVIQNGKLVRIFAKE
jgi:hypothetical protein